MFGSGKSPVMLNQRAVGLLSRLTAPKIKLLLPSSSSSSAPLPSITGCVRLAASLRMKPVWVSPAGPGVSCKLPPALGAGEVVPHSGIMAGMAPGVGCSPPSGTAHGDSWLWVAGDPQAEPHALSCFPTRCQGSCRLSWGTASCLQGWLGQEGLQAVGRARPQEAPPQTTCKGFGPN